MKKIIFWIAAAVIMCNHCTAQDNNGYFLLPGPARTLAPGQKLILNLQRVNLDGTMTGAPGTEVLSWTINGHQADSQDPSQGDLSIDLTLARATYTAPAAAPTNNPLAIAVTARAPGEAKATMTLVCNVTILPADYKVTAEFEVTGPVGIHYKYRGECYTNLLALADGTYMLSPADHTQEMDLEIEDASMTSHSTFIGPKAYKIPFLFTIGKMNPQQPSPTQATVSFNTICPQKGQVEWIFHGDQDVSYTVDIDRGMISYSPGTSQVIPGAAGSPFAMSGATNLDIFQYFGLAQVKRDVSANLTGVTDLTAFSQRMMAHQGDPSYFKTAQGKADLARMQAMQKQLASTGGPQNMQEASLLKAANANLPANQNANKARIMPGLARIRVEDTFNPKSSTAFQGSTLGGVGQEIQASIKISVQKIR